MNMVCHLPVRGQLTSFTSGVVKVDEHLNDFGSCLSCTYVHECQGGILDMRTYS